MNSSMVLYVLLWAYLFPTFHTLHSCMSLTFLFNALVAVLLFLFHHQVHISFRSNTLFNNCLSIWSEMLLTCLLSSPFPLFFYDVLQNWAKSVRKQNEWERKRTKDSQIMIIIIIKHLNIAHMLEKCLRCLDRRQIYSIIMFSTKKTPLKTISYNKATIV